MPRRGIYFPLFLCLLVAQVGIVAAVTEYDLTETTETVTDSVTSAVVPGNDLYQDNRYNYRCQNNFEVFADDSTDRAFSSYELFETTMYSESDAEVDPGTQTLTCWDWATNTSFPKHTHHFDLRYVRKRVRNPYPATTWWQWMMRMTGDQNLSITFDWDYDWACYGAAVCSTVMLGLDVGRVVGDKYHAFLYVPSVDAFSGFPPLNFGASAYLECPESNLITSDGTMADPVLEVGWEETAAGNARFTLGWRWPGGNTSISVTNTSTIPFTLFQRLELDMNGEDYATESWKNDIILLAENSNYRTGLFKEFDRQYIDDMYHYQGAQDSAQSFRFEMEPAPLWEEGPEPSDWTVTEHTAGKIGVNYEMYGHRNYLNISADGSGGNAPQAEYPSINDDATTVSWWFHKSSGIANYYYLYEGANRIGLFRHDTDDMFQYHDGVGYQDIVEMQDDTWHHIRVVFDAGANTHDIYLNDTLQLNGGSTFQPVTNGLDKFHVRTYSAVDGYVLIDALDWDTDSGWWWDSSGLESTSRNAAYDNDTCAFTHDSPFSLWEGNVYHEIQEFDRDDIGIAEPTSGWRYPLPGDTPQHTSGAGLDSVTVPAYATMRAEQPYGQYQWLKGGKATRSGSSPALVHWSGHDAASDNPLSFDEDWLWVGCLTMSQYWDFVADFGPFWVVSDNMAYYSADGRDGYTVPETWWGTVSASTAEPSFEEESMGMIFLDSGGGFTASSNLENRYGDNLERDRRFDACIPQLVFVGYDRDTRLLYFGKYVDGIVYWNTFDPHYGGYNIDTSRFTNEPDVYHTKGSTDGTADAYYFGSFLHRGEWVNSFNTSATTRPLNASYLWEHPALRPPDPGSGYDFEYAQLNATVDDLPATSLYVYYTCLCDLSPVGYVTWGEASPAGWWSSSYNSSQQAYNDLNEEWLRPEYPARYSWLSVFYDARPVNNTNSSWDLFYPEMYQVEYDLVVTATWCAWSTNVAVSNDLLNEIIEMTVPFLLCLLFPWVAVMVTHKKIFAPIGGILGAIISYLSGMLTFGETILVAGLYAGLFAFLQRYQTERGETAW